MTEDFCELEKLENLNLSYNPTFIKLPTGFSKLKNLKKLHLASTGITEFPINLPNLTYLDLYCNKIGLLPKEIKTLIRLKYLNIQNCHFKVLPEELYELEDLETLILSNNPITKISSNIKNLKQLKVLDLQNTSISILPPEIGELINLEKLQCAAKIPKEIKFLKKLTNLHFEKSPDPFIPEICELTNLDELNFRKNKTKIIPYTFRYLQKLIFLIASKNEFPLMPIEFCLLKNLLNLDLSCCSIEIIPPEISNLLGIKSISLHQNNIKYLPIELMELQNLEYLLLSRNSLESIPKENYKLKNLKHLNLSQNNLKSIPIEITQLSKLKLFSTETNQIRYVPKEFSEMKNLTSLNFSFNSIRVLPIQLLDRNLPFKIEFRMDHIDDQVRDSIQRKTLDGMIPLTNHYLDEKTASKQFEIFLQIPSIYSELEEWIKEFEMILEYWKLNYFYSESLDRYVIGKVKELELKYSIKFIEEDTYWKQFLDWTTKNWKLNSLTSSELKFLEKLKLGKIPKLDISKLIYSIEIELKRKTKLKFDSRINRLFNLNFQFKQ